MHHGMTQGPTAGKKTKDTSVNDRVKARIHRLERNLGDAIDELFKMESESLWSFLKRWFKRKFKR